MPSPRPEPKRVIEIINPTVLRLLAKDRLEYISEHSYDKKDQKLVLKLSRKLSSNKELSNREYNIVNKRYEAVQNSQEITQE